MSKAGSGNGTIMTSIKSLVMELTCDLSGFVLHQWKRQEIINDFYGFEVICLICWKFISGTGDFAGADNKTQSFWFIGRTLILFCVLWLVYN